VLSLSPWLAVVLLSAAGSPSPGYDYHPLDVGHQWYYVGDGPLRELMTITGAEEILGADTRVRRQERDDQIFENFWSTDGEGNLHLHGGRNLTFPHEVAYVPPIRMVEAPLYLGNEWTTENVGLYDLQGHPYGYWFDAARQVYSEGTLLVPAGQFYAYGVGWADSIPVVRNQQGACFDLLGYHLAEPGSEDRAGAIEFYVDGLGLARQADQPGSQQWLDLKWWEIPVPAEGISWGAVKALFR
jgi:hypothetical protein